MLKGSYGCLHINAWTVKNRLFAAISLENLYLLYNERIINIFKVATERILEALRLANAKFVTQLPAGLDTEVCYNQYWMF